MTVTMLRPRGKRSLLLGPGLCRAQRLAERGEASPVFSPFPPSRRRSQTSLCRLSHMFFNRMGSPLPPGLAASRPPSPEPTPEELALQRLRESSASEKFNQALVELLEAQGIALHRDGGRRAVRISKPPADEVTVVFWVLTKLAVSSDGTPLEQRPTTLEFAVGIDVTGVPEPVETEEWRVEIGEGRHLWEFLPLSDPKRGHRHLVQFFPRDGWLLV